MWRGPDQPQPCRTPKKTESPAQPTPAGSGAGLAVELHPIAGGGLDDGRHPGRRDVVDHEPAGSAGASAPGVRVWTSPRDRLARAGVVALHLLRAVPGCPTTLSSEPSPLTCTPVTSVWPVPRSRARSVNQSSPSASTKTPPGTTTKASMSTGDRSTWSPPTCSTPPLRPHDVGRRDVTLADRDRWPAPGATDWLGVAVTVVGWGGPSRRRCRWRSRRHSHDCQHQP